MSLDPPIKKSVLALIAANLVPLFGVLFFGWSLFMLIALYWLENIVTGIYTIARMRKATGMPRSQLTANLRGNSGKPYAPERKGEFVSGFIIHYGLFTAVHGFLIFAFFQQSQLHFIALLPGILSLFVSHGISYYVNFIETGEYQCTAPPDFFLHPYLRIIVLHLTIVLGAILVVAYHSRLIMLVILIFLKTAVDVMLHVKENRSPIPGR